jgi:hypothetical protein
MGTLLYLILKLMGRIDLPDDWVNLCHLVAIDSVALAILFNGFFRRGESRGHAEKLSDRK